ncbi:MAG: hypothetical protein OXI96_06255 [Acidimicrobiaceae bacterium]|nr:hypothetical protein [Acidimicrobiaceae bacterium]
MKYVVGLFTSVVVATFFWVADSSKTTQIVHSPTTLDATIDGQLVNVSSAWNSAQEASDTQQTSNDNYNTKDDDNLAPVWPFRGIVSYHRGQLQYWNTETGNLRTVRLEWEACTGQPNANEEYVEIGIWANLFETILRVPWGDEAYPYFGWPEIEDTRSRQVSVGDETISADFVNGWLHIATSQQERYYRDNLQEFAPLVSTPQELPVAPDWDTDGIMNPVVVLDGTDGFHYGWRIIHAEPTCPWEDGFIVAGDTGEVVACGWARGGALLINPEGSPSLVDNFVVPKLATSEQCTNGPLDISHLPLS